MAENKQNISSQSSKSDNKRNLEDSEETTSPKEGFKKARFSWQIKGKVSDGTNVTQKESIAEKNCDKSVDAGACKLSLPPAVNDKQCSVEFNDCSSSSLPKGVATETLSESDEDFPEDIGNTIDKLMKAPINETKTKFEMLREMGSEYSERIEQFLKSQANRFECESNSDESACKDESQRVPMPLKGTAESSNMEHHSGHHSCDTNRGRLTFDSPQLNHNLFNISSWLWQKQELGCAIVDNVFNRTLEELGLSPDPEANLQATTRVSVENQSIEAAINHQGLAVGIETNEDTFDSVSSTEETATPEQPNSSSIGRVAQKSYSTPQINNDVKNEERSSLTEPKYAEGKSSVVKEEIRGDNNKSKPKIEKIVKPDRVDKPRSKQETSQEIHSLSANSTSCSFNLGEAISEKRNERLKVDNTYETDDTAEACDDITDQSEGSGMDMNEDKSTPDANIDPVNILDIAMSTTIMTKGLNIR